MGTKNQNYAGCHQHTGSNQKGTGELHRKKKILAYLTSGNSVPQGHGLASVLLQHNEDIKSECKKKKKKKNDNNNNYNNNNDNDDDSYYYWPTI